MQKETKIKFYQAKNDGISISITAHLDDGKLSLQGLDHGSSVDEIRGMGEDYEYTLSLDKENSQRLFELLEVTDKTDKEKLEKVRDTFNKDGGISGLEEYCESHGIRTSFSCWP